MANHTGTSTITVTKNDSTTETLTGSSDLEIMTLLAGTNGLAADVSTLQLSTQADGGAAVTITFSKATGATEDTTWVG